MSRRELPAWKKPITVVAESVRRASARSSRTVLSVPCVLPREASVTQFTPPSTLIATPVPDGMIFRPPTVGVWKAGGSALASWAGSVRYLNSSVPRVWPARSTVHARRLFVHVSVALESSTATRSPAAGSRPIVSNSCCSKGFPGIQRIRPLPAAEIAPPTLSTTFTSSTFAGAEGA